MEKVRVQSGYKAIFHIGALTNHFCVLVRRTYRQLWTDQNLRMNDLIVERLLSGHSQSDFDKQTIAFKSARAKKRTKICLFGESEFKKYFKIIVVESVFTFETML